MNVNVLKDFLISLGFQIDGAGYSKFEAAVVGATKNVIQLGLAAEGAAASVLLFTAKIASGLDQLYWASQRTGATVAGIQAIGYAASQTGSSAAAAQSALEGMARFLRNNPGGEGFLNRLGVQTRDASGNMRDMASIFTGVGSQLSKMPYYRANQYAQMLGIDENTLLAMRRGLGQFSGEYTAMAKAIGLNADAAAAQSNKFMTSLRAFGEMAGLARDKIGANLASGLSGSLDNFRRQVIENFPKIEGTITQVIHGILWFAGVFGQVVYRLIQAVTDIIGWWNSLDKSTQQLIETLGGLVIAWRLLNAAFMMSPIGWVVALGVAILALYDDYKTWQEGGKSLIDWSKWAPGINYAKKELSGLGTDFLDLVHKIESLGVALGHAAGKLLSFIHIDTSKFSGKWLFDQIILSVKDSIKFIGALTDALTKLVNGDFKGAYQSLKDAANLAVSSPLGQGINALGTGAGNAIANGVNSLASGASNAVSGVVNGIFTDPLGGPGSYNAYNTIKQPHPTAAGANLLNWMKPALSQLESLYHLPAGVLNSIAITESGGNPNAVSKAGAEGLFQIMPDTARRLGMREGDEFDPQKAAQAAAQLLSKLLRQYGGNLQAALAAYNWGPGNIAKYGMALMPQETRNYVPKILSNMPGGSIQQETNITINGVSDPMAAGRVVEQRQLSINSRLAQQSAGNN